MQPALLLLTVRRIHGNAVLLTYQRASLSTKALASFALRLASVYMPLANKCGAAAKVLALEPQAASRTVGTCVRLPPDAVGKVSTAAFGKTHL